MGQRRLVIDGKRLNYTGPMRIEEFYKTVKDWAAVNGFEIELKKKAETVKSDHRQIEWTVEIWKMMEEGHQKIVVRLRSLFSNIKDIEIKKKKQVYQVNTADCLLLFDGFVEADTEHRWYNQPLQYFLKGIFEKYIWKYDSGQYEPDVIGAVNNLFNILEDHLKSFGNRFK